MLTHVCQSGSYLLIVSAPVALLRAYSLFHVLWLLLMAFNYCFPFMCVLASVLLCYLGPIVCFS